MLNKKWFAFGSSTKQERNLKFWINNNWEITHTKQAANQHEEKRLISS